jgi:hypothetical protein
LPPIVAWNYPTPAALARYLAEQSLAPADRRDQPATNGVATSPFAATESVSNSSDDHRDDQRLTSLLDEIENLSDEEVQRLLAEEQSRK